MILIQLVAGKKMETDKFLDMTVLGLCHVTMHSWRYWGVVLSLEKDDIWNLCQKVPTGFLYVVYIFLIYV